MAFAAACFSTWAAVPPGYYDSANGLSGTDLKNALYNIIKNHTILPYSSSSQTDTADALKVIDEDPGNTANVLLHYKGTSVAKSSFGSSWNREHLWPQSLGADVSPKVSDLHHLFAEDMVLNSSRGNSVFNAVPNPTNSGYGNRWTGYEFEVRDPQKGNVARAVLYMDVRYPEMELVNTANPSYNQMAWRDTLIAWSNNDPPDAAELLRNDRVYDLYQHNRNPFVDHPEYVNLIYAPIHNGDTLSINYTNRTGAGIAAGAINHPFLSLHLTANSNEWDLGSLAIEKLGTLADAYITSVRLYRDTDNNGAVGASDVLLDTRTFSGGLATFTLSNPSRITTTQANFLIVASLGATATNGSWLAVRVRASGLTHSATGGTDVNPGFVALDSGVATVSGGVSNGDNLNVSFVNRAGAMIAAGAADYPLLSIDLQAATNEWDLASVAVSQAGTIPDANVLALKLYDDMDNNGTLSAGDVLLDTRTFSAGAAVFSLASPRRITTTQAHLLVVGSIAGPSPNGATFQLRANASGILSSTSGGTDNNPVFSAYLCTSAAVTGGVSNGDTLSVGGTSRAPASALASTADVPLLSVNLAASPGEWDLATMSVTKLGTAGDSVISLLKLYDDTDGDGAVGGADALLGSTAFSGGAAMFNVAGGAVRITTVTSTLLIAADLSPAAPNGATIGVRLNTNGLTSSASGGADLNPAFAQIDSALTAIENNNVGTVKIVMVSTRSSSTFGGDGGDEFVVLANHSPSAININAWELRTRGGGGTTYTLVMAGTIPGYGHFLIGSTPYAGNVEGRTPDYTDTGATGIAGGMGDTTGRTIGLFNGPGTGAQKIDGFSFSGGPTLPDILGEQPLYGGSQTSPATQVIHRKQPSGMTGYYADTDNNLVDLEIATGKAPLNSSDILNIPVQPTAADDGWRLFE